MEWNIQSRGTAEDFLRNGEEFLEAGIRCFGKVENDKIKMVEGVQILQLPVASVVNFAFASEMFLKALLLQITGHYKKDHNLLLLFNSLPEDVQLVVAKFCIKTDDLVTFKNYISRYAKVFIEDRYYIEHDKMTEISPMQMYALAFNLFQIVKSYILRKEERKEGIVERILKKHYANTSSGVNYDTTFITP